MADPRLILALDIGTSAARAVLFDTQAGLVSQVRQPYPMLFPNPGWSEQDPEAIVEAVIAVLREAARALPPEDQLAGVVLSSQLYSIIALDSEGAPLSNSLTWGDTRSASFADAIRSQAESSELIRRTGCPIQAIYPLSKILWLKANLDLPEDVRFISIKDYVLLRLTGQLISDWSMASASGLLNIAGLGWDDEALSICGITTDNLPELVSTRHIIRHWRADMAEHIGISATLPLIVGAGDAPLANIGVGAIESDTLAVNIGTSAAARVLIPEPQIDASGGLWTYVADVGKWTMGGIIGGAGAVYDWLLKKLLFSGRDASIEELYAEADRLAASVDPGAEGLLFLPYLAGEQSPGWNPASRGLIHGLSFNHGTGHLVRAALEGIAFSLFRVMQAVDAVRQSTTTTIRLTGGLTSSPVFRQILKDVFGIPVFVPTSTESSARGAAILGWLALGEGDDYAAFRRGAYQLLPDNKTHAFYQTKFQDFCNLND